MRFFLLFVFLLNPLLSFDYKEFAEEEKKRFSLKDQEYWEASLQMKMDPEISDQFLQELPEPEVSEFFQRLHEGPELQMPDTISEKESYFLNSQEQFLQKESQEPEELVQKNVRCLRKGPPTLYRLDSTLNVELQKEKKQKKCLGHKRSYKTHKSREAALEEKGKKEESFEKDPQILSFSVWTEKEKKSFRNKHKVYASFFHHPDSFDCDHFEESVLVEEKILSESWTKPKAEKGCELIEEICIEGEDERRFGTKHLRRPCWKKQYVFVCEEEVDERCPLQGKCQKKSSRCIKNKRGKCAVWEDLFSCESEIKKPPEKFWTPKAFCELDEKSDDSGFFQAFNALKAFDGFQAQEDENLSIFAGELFRCKKSTAGKAIYDCCASMKGFSISAGLREHCSADEQCLAKKRQEGLCHFLGSYRDKSLLKREFQSSCCFPSKLARIVQEEGRKQLGIGWGTAKDPICRGFSLEELSKIDFSRIDFSDVLEEKLFDKEKWQGQIKNFQLKKMEEKVKKISEKAKRRALP